MNSGLQWSRHSSPVKRNLSGNGTISGITMKINSQQKKGAGYRLQCGLLLPLGQACNYIQLSEEARKGTSDTNNKKSHHLVRMWPRPHVAGCCYNDIVLASG